MPIIISGYRRNIVGRGCPCGQDCFLNRHYAPRPRNSADRTNSWRKRSGTRREKKVARGVR